MMRSYSDLPEEITFNILSLIPPKSVGLCRCVSKSWRDLLTRPDFMRTHFQIATNTGDESLIFFDPSRCLLYASLRDAHYLFDKITLSTSKVNFPDYFYAWGWVYASCNGLLLAEDSRGVEFILNPITREIRQLPPKLPPSFWILDNSTSKDNFIYGFGYDSVNDDYKVIVSHYVLDSDDDEDLDTFEIIVDFFSLKSGNWKRVGCDPHDCCIGENLASGIFLGGFIHWLAMGIREDEFVILAFDLAEEKFVKVPPPDLMEGDMVVSFHIAVIDGCLCLFNSRENYVWMMKDYGVQESWTMFEIDGPEGFELTMISGSLDRGEVVLRRDDLKLMMLNVKGGTPKDVVADGIATDLCPHSGVSFVETLVSPHSWWH